MRINQTIITSLLAAAPLCAAAQATFEVGGVVYTEDLSDPSKLAVIVVAKKSPMVMEGISAYEGDIVIPSTVEHDLDTYQVTGIAQGAFMGAEVESLVINHGPTKILKGGISCQKLEKLVLPSTMTSLDGIFAPALEELTLGDNIKTIEASFIGGSGLTELSLPSALKTLTGSFITLEGLAKLTFGPNVKKIENSFMNMSALESVVLPGSLRTLKGSFVYCPKLTSVEIQEGLQKIDGSFASCYALKEIKLPKSLATIENSFSDGASTELILPEGVTTIKDSFTSGWPNLTTLTFPNSLTSVSGSFRGCGNLKEVHFGTGFSDIESAIGNNLASIEKMYCPWAVPPAAPSGLRGRSRLITVYVPKGSAQAYAEAWNLAEVNKGYQRVTVEEADF